MLRFRFSCAALVWSACWRELRTIPFVIQVVTVSVTTAVGVMARCAVVPGNGRSPTKTLR